MIAANEVVKHRRMTVDEILRYSFGSVQGQWTAIWQWAAMLAVVILVNFLPFLTLFLNSNVVRSLNYFNDPFAAMPDLSGGQLAVFFVLLGLALLFDLFFGLMTIAWFSRTSLDHQGRIQRAFGERIGQAFLDLKSMLPLLVLGLVIGIGIFVVVLVFAGGMVAATDGNNLAQSMASNVFSSALNLFQAVILTRISSWLLLMIEDKMGLIEALKYSWHMSKGRMIRIFGYMLMISVCIVLLTVLFMIAMVILWIPAMLTQFNPAVTSVVGFVTVVAVSIFAAITYQIDSAWRAGVYYGLMRENTPEPSEPGLEESLNSPEIYL